MGIAGRDPASEEHPGVRSIAGARNLESTGHAKFITRVHEGAGVLSALGCVEIDGEEMYRYRPPAGHRHRLTAHRPDGQR